MPNNSNHPKSFYDSLSNDYHLIFRDWDASIKRQSKILDALIQKYAKENVQSILDCSCGIGTQALGLAKLGYQVYATFFSNLGLDES